MQPSTIISYIVLLLVAGGFIYYFSQSKPMEQTSSQPTVQAIPDATSEPTQEPVTQASTSSAVVVMKTNKGDITLELFTEKMPITTGNFLKLSKEGFYNKVKFHRVLKNFMIQGGDPKGDGTGGPGYAIQDEFVAGLSNVRGAISMANTGQKNSGGSQFFINLVDNTNLDFDKPPFTSSHPVFGKVVAGMDVVDAIAQVQVNAGGLPAEPVVIESVEVK